ncbi:iron-siderophore ABC transporter substrate-binding protein [Corynebacterium aquilae]|uniref:Iron siderophore ABC transporter substrate-binding protein n=1 Tax=Corynebacterium aquilae DSM 44791 TaxID=1431546 RepID=A0A1L7CHQ7_9CORY|nr:iron-siderophore ABC transporter substrate-binding protein [Corynebacterium aquilae]APT85303.1 iron siderophore ABC transporter substrate-binding protein [Corynebacterium aquilae DSM 44791]
MSRQISRRNFLTAATITLGAAGLAACGNSSSANNPLAGPTREVQDIEGNTVTVPAHPERIVALSEPALDGLLALDITPVGCVAGRGQRTVAPYLPEKARDIELLGSVSQINFEAVGAAQPDLILVDGTSINNNKPALDALSAIAPVVYLGYAGGDWRINFRNLAAAVDKVDEGEAVMAAYDEEVAAAREHLGKYDEDTFSIVRWEGNSAALILNDLPPGQALKDLGLKRPPSQDRMGRGHSEPVSNENLKDIDADYMFFGTLGGSSIANPDAGGSVDIEAAEQAIASAVQVPGFTDLIAFQDGHIIPVDGSVWTSTGGPLLMRRIVHDVNNSLD